MHEITTQNSFPSLFLWIRSVIRDVQLSISQETQENQITCVKCFCENAIVCQGIEVTILKVTEFMYIQRKLTFETTLLLKSFHDEYIIRSLTE